MKRWPAAARVTVRAMTDGGSQLRWWHLPKWRAFLAISLSFVTIVASTSMVFVLLPSIASDFGVTLGAVGWVVIIEALVISALLLPVGGLADGIGRRRIYVWGLVIFGAGAVLTGFAPGFIALIGARIFMSVGNAMVQSVGTGMLAAAFPANEKGLAMGAQTTAVAVGAASGPMIGGLQTLFLLLSIPVALSIIAALLILEDDRPALGRELPPYDGLGGALSGVAVVMLVFTISNPLGMAWVSAPILGGLLVFAVLLGAFIRQELRHPNPMLELRLFAVSAFRTAVLVRVLGFIGNTTTTLLLPVYLLSLRGFADRTAGMVIFCSAVGVAIGAQISGRLADRIGPGPPTMIGLGLQLVVVLALSFSDNDTALVLLVPVVFVSGLGLSLWNVPNNSTMMASVPPKNFAVVGAFTNVTRTMGNVLGQALAAAIVVAIMAGRGFDVPLDEVASSPGAGEAFLAGWRAAYLVTAALAVATMFIARRLPFSPVVAPSGELDETTEM